MSQNVQSISFKDQSRQMVAKMMSERDAQRLYQQAMQELTAHLQGNWCFLRILIMSQSGVSGMERPIVIQP